MITGFHRRAKGLEQFQLSGNRAGLKTTHVRRVERILDRLDAATRLSDLAAPGWRLHELKGDRAGTWAVNVSRHWRITFRIDDTRGFDVYDVLLEEYH